MRIHLQLLVSVGGLVVLMVVIATGMLVVTASLAGQGSQIELAARQGTLAEHLAVQALRYSQAPTSDDARALEKSAEAFAQSLDALMNGGTVSSGIDGLASEEIKAIDDDDARAAGRTIAETWGPVTEAVKRLIASSGQDRSALDAVVGGTRVASIASARLTSLLVGQSAGTEKILLIVEVLILLNALAAGAVASVVGNRLSRSLERLAMHADQISQGKSDEPVPTDGPGEVGTLGKSLDRMRVSLKKAMELIESS